MRTTSSITEKKISRNLWLLFWQKKWMLQMRRNFPNRASPNYVSFNPLTPVPAVTCHVKTHPQFPVLALTGREKACENNCLSYPPWRDFGPPIVLLLLRTNKPMTMDFLSIFLGDFRGPRKTVFCLKITRSKSAGNHGALRAKSTNFQSLVFIP